MGGSKNCCKGGSTDCLRGGPLQTCYRDSLYYQPNFSHKRGGGAGPPKKPLNQLVSITFISVIGGVCVS